MAEKTENDTNTTHLQRLSIIATDTSKSLNDMAPEYLSKLLEAKLSHYDIRKQKTLQIPRVETTKYGLNSFWTLAAEMWNNLPNHIRKLQYFQKSPIKMDWRRVQMCHVP